MKIWKYGDNINTDQLFPGKYTYTCSTPDEIKSHLFEDLDNDFAPNVKIGDIILAGKNFGCGSSREEAVFVFKKFGIKVLIASSFSRIYFRNCINLGIAPIIIKKSNEIGQTGDLISINFQRGVVKNENSGQKFTFATFPPFLQKYLEKEGAIGYLQSLN